jgi:2-methylisocitrate lyase-like PEP mutase family enzyme
MNAQQKSKAEALRAMHAGAKILVLPNAWDVASAVVFEKAGAKAIATSSAGVAFSLGYADGQRIPRAEMMEVVARIAAKVSVPVTADAEAGYGRAPEDVAKTTLGVIEAGAVGFNLEDVDEGSSAVLFSMQEQVERVQAAREAARRAGIHVVINARTDVFLAEVGEPARRLDETVRRLNAYRAAGADCLFAPGVADAATITELVRQVKGPLNILAGPGAPMIAELQKLGVARVSLGSGMMRVAVSAARDAAVELLERGSYSKLTGNLISFREMNEMMK